MVWLVRAPEIDREAVTHDTVIVPSRALDPIVARFEQNFERSPASVKDGGRREPKR